jgi:hypothetical protein
MTRNDISLYAQKAKRKARTNFKPPSVKRARKAWVSQVKAVVVVMASNTEGLSFSQQETWLDWARSSDEVGFAVYVEDHAGFEQQCSAEQWEFWRKFLCPVQSSSAWGEFTLLQSELLALKWAQKTFREALWFYVVSGDSIPPKTPSRFVEGPLIGSSILGFDPGFNCDSGRILKVRAPEDFAIFEHSQWKVIAAPHAACLVKELLPKLPEWKRCVSVLRRTLCQCVVSPDEWVIGTVLRGLFPQEDWTDGVCIMEQIFVQKPCAKCKQRTGRAKGVARYRVGTLEAKGMEGQFHFCFAKSVSFFKQNKKRVR